ncbi:MAG TPA: hypothetical protein VF178_14355 [Gemmatimonadaceae bacterium]
MARAGWLLLALLIAPACYRYVPELEANPSVGSEYRLHLTEAGTQQLQPILGQGIAAVDGRIIGASDSSYQVTVGKTIPRDDPRPVIWAGEVVFLPLGAIERVERRELDRGRTMRAAALYTAGALVVGSIWLSVSGKASAKGGPPPVITPPP